MIEVPTVVFAWLNKWKILAASFVLCLGTTATSSSQSISFSHDGNIENFDVGIHFLAGTKKDRIVVDRDEARTEGSSIRFTLYPGDCGGTVGGGFNDCDAGNERIALHLGRKYPSDHEFYTLSLKLGPEFKSVPFWEGNEDYSDVTLYQFHRNDHNPCYTIFWAIGYEKLAVDDRCSNNVSNDFGSRKVYFLDVDPYQWNDLMVEAVWTSKPDGKFHVIVNGSSVLELIKPTIVPRGNHKSLISQLDIYKHGRPPKSTEPLRVWFDNVGVHKKRKFVPEFFLPVN